uniref:non-specific serine/threonine protein kinase n=1 Tax=Leptobrachium leishanense TaxID=445787 RepID=A0A8C5P9B4_9ANUR
MSNLEEREENVKKLVVRLKNIEEGKQVESLVQILDDLYSHTSSHEIFRGKNVHSPLLLVLEYYMKVADIQKAGWSLLCRLIDICPDTLSNLQTPVDLGSEWDVLGVHQQILKILSTYLTNVSVLSVGLKALSSILVSDVINFLLLDHEEDVFLLIFKAMKLFPDNEEIQMYGCQSLYQLLIKVPTEQLIEFVENEDHLIILKVLTEFKNSEAVVLPALQVLLPVADPRNNLEILMSGNVRCYNFLIEAMKNFPNIEKIQEVCCSLFQKLTFEAFFNILVINEAHEFIIKAVNYFFSNAKLQAAALSCLAMLTETIILNKDLDNGEDVEVVDGQLYWFEPSFKALKLHKKNTCVQEAACWALNNLFMYQPELHDYIGDEQYQYPVHREVMLSLLMHSSSKEVFQASTSTLATLCERNGNTIRKVLLEKGVHINVLDIMKRHLHFPEAAESACRVLNHLFNGRSLIIAMKKHENVPSVQLEAMRAVLQMIYDGMYCSSKGLFILMAFINNPAIQECGLKLLECLAECSGALELLSEMGALDTVLHTLQMYPGSQEIQCFGLSLLSSLITKKDLCIATLHLLSTHIVATLQRYKDVVRIQKEVCMCFFKRIKSPFQSLCYGCFAEITAKEELRNKLLVKACAENNLVLVECLLLLGADVNKNSKHTPLIMQVCEKGDNLNLVELLLNNGVREDDTRKALQVSILKCDNETISLLLKKLGLDLANNSICLGGFHLGRIEHSWLSPLFTEKHLTLKCLTPFSGTLLARMVFRYQKKSGPLMSCRISRESTNSEDLHKGIDGPFSPDVFEETSFVFNDEGDSEGSEGSIPMKKSKSYDMLRDSKTDHVTSSLQKHSNSLVWEDVLLTLVLEKKTFRKMISKLALFMKKTDSFPSLADKEYIRSLDLSANDLESIDLITKKSTLKSHMERLERLELQQNSLSVFPKSLCDALKSLTHLDLRNNTFSSFPSCVLEINSIVFLDLSRNEIGPSLDLSKTSACTHLKHLNLSYNQLKTFPDAIGNIAVKLEELVLEGNGILEILTTLCLPELRTINLNKNSISSITPDFLKDCANLETFTATTNMLGKILPPFLDASLLFLKIKVIYVIIKICENLVSVILRCIDLSNNQIENLPCPLKWASLNLREINLSNNQIRALDLGKDACRWSRLEKLQLSHNNLKEIPPEVGCFENMTCFDVSYNPDLRTFPDEMGKLSKVWDLPLDGLQLDIDLKTIGCKARDIIRFLQQRLKKAVPYNRMKLLIMGNTGSGKTTLVRQLMKRNHPNQESEKFTVGIDVKDWHILARSKVKREIVLNVWDFAGQEEFYSTHPHFMTPRALYLVVYDLSKGESEVDAIKPWLFNIKARASSSPVILVGTHLDVSDEKQQKACNSKIIRELFNQHALPSIKEYHLLNATEESDYLKKLRKAIIKECLDFKIRDQPVLGQLIPDSYLELEKRILIERRNVPIEFPVIKHKRVQEIVEENQLQLDEHELPHAIHFLKESGVLLHFEDPVLQLRDLYFVDPQWLCKIMAQILTVKSDGGHRNPKGIIRCTNVERFLSKTRKFPENYMSQYFKLLEKFQIALPLDGGRLLIPSSLSDHRPVIELPHCENSEIIIRLYEMSYFPMGFWSRLINRLLEVSSYMLSGRERAQRPHKMYWRQGIYLNWSPEAYTLVESTTLQGSPNSFLKVTVPSCRKGCVLLGQVVDHIDSLMEEWFPGLLETDICGESETLLKKWVLYSFDDSQEHKKILLSDLLTKAEGGDLLVNPDDHKSTIPISQIAPDLVLADLPRHIMLNSEELEFEQAPEFLLGDGGFGSVYRALYKGKDVAVKIFNKHTSLRLLRQELTVLSHLHHPSLVCLLAAGVRPRMLVMELAPKGSLDRLLLQDSSNLTRTLQHRIALHVADGLRYLHSSMIIYRDLKPHNVLLYTLYPNSAVIAKIADYGIAQYCCRMGIKTSEGTPGFRAPEVARGNVIYNQQADVYSFGLLLYDILTAGARMIEGLKFPNEFDEVAIQGKLPDPVKEYNCAAWPEVEVLIKKCLKENPQERPNSAQVYGILNSAELLCLMRNLVIPSTLTVECMAAAVPCLKKHTVWVGSGNAEKGQISRINLIQGGHTCEDFSDSRILCLTLVTLLGRKEHWILVGTQSGEIMAANTEELNKKHCMQKMMDSVICLLHTHFLRQSQKTCYILAGTANGSIAVFEESSTNAVPLKVLSVGDMSTPVMSLCESTYSSEKTSVWGIYGTKVILFSSDFSIQKTIDTKASVLYSHGSSSDQNITCIAVDKHIYIAKKYSPFVEIWDKKTEKLLAVLEEIEKRQDDVYTARVKALFLQKNTALWVGTGGGHVLLIDQSTRRPMRIIPSCCDTIRCMAPAQLGKRVSSLIYKIIETIFFFVFPVETPSFLSVWDTNLPHEVQNLKKHNELRQEEAERLRISLD